VIEGPNGIDNLLHMQIRIDWDKQGYEGVLESTIKKYNSMIHTRSIAWSNSSDRTNSTPAR
jgi:2-methylcitrate dehydratase